MKYVGIDYSMTSPSICLYDSLEGFVTFHYLTSTKKYEGLYKLQNGWEMTGHAMGSWNSDQQRFNWISDWATWIIREKLFGKPQIITIEGYAMGAKGLVFNIAENTGLLKHKLWMAELEFITPAPSAVKKFATGKGNANKEKMQESFIHETSLNIKATLGMTEASWNPSSDIIDSYFLMRWGQQHLATRNAS